MANETTTPQKPSPAEALSTAKQVEQLADQLSACADSIHERVMRDIHRSQEQHHGEVPEAEQSAARAMLDAEIELRQRANRLYADAAACIVTSLGQPQQRLIALTADAARKIKTITRISDGMSLAARLLGLAAAAATGQALPVLAAFGLLQTQLDTITLHEAPPAPVAPSTPAVPPA